MNGDQSDRERRLLADVLGGDSFAAFDYELKRKSLAEFRRARFIRRAGIISVVVALLAAAGGSLLFMHSQPGHVFVDSPPIQLPANPNSTAIKANAGIITEAQLVGLFPSNTCFIAEVEGRKVLVFRSEELRRKYLD